MSDSCPTWKLEGGIVHTGRRVVSHAILGTADGNCWCCGGCGGRGSQKAVGLVGTVASIWHEGEHRRGTVVMVAISRESGTFLLLR